MDNCDKDGDNESLNGDKDQDVDLDSLFGSDEGEEVDEETPQISTAEVYKQHILEEEKEVEAIASSITKESKILTRYELYIDLSKSLLDKSIHQDITPMFVDGTPILIDGFSLITCVLQDENYNKNNGGQTLHFIYLCERILELVSRKGGSCEIVFFDDKSSVLSELPELHLMLSLLKTHLMKNTNISCHIMDSMFSTQFINYVEETHPCFIIVDFTLIDTFRERLTAENTKMAEQLFYFQAAFCLSLGLYCVDLCFIELYNNLLFSFVCSTNIKHYKKSMMRDFSQFRSQFLDEFTFSQSTELKLNSVECANNVNEFVALQVAMLLQGEPSSGFINQNEIVKVYLLYHAISETLPLNLRSFNSTCLDNSSVGLKSIIDKIVYYIDFVLCNTAIIDGYDCSKIADLWQGNLFENLFWYVSLTDAINFGDKLKVVYKDILGKFSDKLSDDSVIISNHVKDKVKKSVDETKIEILFSIKQTATPSTRNIKHGGGDIVQNLNNVITKFCSNVAVQYGDCNLPEYFKNIITTDVSYEEKYHWHVLKPLTDTIERVKDSSKEYMGLTMKKRDRKKNQFVYYMNMYGSNIEGKILENDPIIVSTDNKKVQNVKKIQKKSGKTSSKKAVIIQQNIMRKQKELLDVEKYKFDNFLKVYKTNKTGRLGETKNLLLVDQMLLQIDSDEYKCRFLYCKVEVLSLLWRDTYKWESNNSDIDLTYLKELFLTVKQLLNLTKKVNSVMVESQLKKLTKILCSTGFSDIAEKWKLPASSDSSSDKFFPSNLQSYIRFQLKHLGPELEREIEGEPDNRVSGFIPDPWQRKLFDIVDKGESALIVAPTSSGKTYASYYCIRKVLKESNEGKIVYVAPTKALVNQVAATVYARFKNKKMPNGMSVFGIFTRDYKHFAHSCQVLITVPECLELLLMSPRQYGFVESLKYVIFDEVHCLAGQGGGITWERCLMLIPCPFLALSATIQNPDEFWLWMSEMEKYKKSLNPNLGTKVHLVVHSERHNDLIRHIYGADDELHHIHPYAYLKDYILKVHKGIPSHISLAPSETVELYDSMCLSSPNDSELSCLEPDIYFGGSATGFISKQEVKKYETELNKILNKWVLNKDRKPAFDNTIRQLYNPLQEHEGGTKMLGYFEKKIIPFIEKLQSKNMLPALLFSYNRGYCEAIGSEVTKYYQTLENNEIVIKKQKSKKNNDAEVSENGQSKNKKVVKLTSFDKTGKPERFKKDVKELFPLEITKCSGKFSLKGMHRIDNKDLQYIERKLSFGFKKNSLEIDSLRRGVGVHHGGIATSLRQSVEMLFRSKFLNVVFATGTLALGIHMPCKTVVILGDSPFLNTLEYHQMSGRSGRRGFDKTGDVVFFGLDTNKMRVLMTSKLPKMKGNFPLTVTTVLRILLLVNDVTDNCKKTDSSYEATSNRVLTMLSQGLLYRSEKNLRDQMKHFVLFSCQLLMVQSLLDIKCQPTLMAGLATHLHYHEPGNLAFIHLLRSGTLAKICKKSVNGNICQEACEHLVILLCRLFTRIPYKDYVTEIKFFNSIVLLPDLPDYVTMAIKQYNSEVETVYKHYFEGFSQHISDVLGDDCKLPISEIKFSGSAKKDELLTKGGEATNIENLIAQHSNQNLICSSFAGLSGQTDENLYSQNSLIGNIRHEVFTDCKVIPLIDLETDLNSYAYDFYKHGIVSSINRDNGLKSGHDYVMLLDFLLILRTIETSLTEIGMYSDPEIASEDLLDKNNLNLCVLNTFSHIRESYETFFNTAYNIRKR